MNIFSEYSCVSSLQVEELAHLSWHFLNADHNIDLFIRHHCNIHDKNSKYKIAISLKNNLQLGMLGS